MDFGLKGKVVLVTGGAGGIGTEICRAFLTEGAQVAVHYHTHQKEAENLAREATRGQAIATKADLTRETDVETLFATIEAQLGPVDILVNNAGIWIETPTPVHKMSLAQWQTTIDTNMTSTFLCFRRFLLGIERHRIAEPSAVIIGSTAGVYGEADHIDYAASKSGITAGFLLTLKNEIVRLSPRGRVNAVCPSWIKTGMAESFVSQQDLVKRALQTVALRKIGTPRDVAGATLFLASSALSGHLSGHSLVLAGGMEGRVLFEKHEIEIE